MDTKLFRIDPQNITRQSVKEAGGILARGGLCAFPTETVYGLGANALDEKAVAKIFKAKGRPSDNPLIVHIAGHRMMKDLVRDAGEDARLLAERFMPGPITLIMKKQPSLGSIVTAGLDTVAVRFPSHPVAQALILAAGVPVAAPSANLSGKPSPTEACHVVDDLWGRVDCIIDGGGCQVGVESTVVDVSGDHPVILRPGIITLEQIREVTPAVTLDKHVLSMVSVEETPKSPGMKYKHYAPEAQVTVVEGAREAVREKILALLKEHQETPTGVLTYYKSDYPADVVLSAGTTQEEYAACLFTRLREFDRAGARVVFAEYREEEGCGLAVRNRLYKSAAYHVIHV